MTSAPARKAVIPVLIVLALAARGMAQDKAFMSDPRVRDAFDVLDKWLDAEAGYKRFPGLVMAVVHDQDVVWTASHGYANIEAKIPARPDTIFSICSISKLFTSVAVMQLRDAGKLQLDDPLSKHLDWFDIKRTDPKAPPITVRSVMRHSSGLPSESDQPYGGEPDMPWKDLADIVRNLPGQETLYPPDTYFEYSNLGLSLLGEVVAKVSGRPYGEYIRTRILEPLGMTDTTPFLPEREYGRRLAVGYGRWERAGDRARMPFFQARGATPAAGLASTALDLAKFASWQFRALDNRDAAVLSGYTLREMHRVNWVDWDRKVMWGLGFMNWRHRDTTLVGHSGGCPGYRTKIALSPKDRIAVIVMINAADADVNGYANKPFDLVVPAVLEAARTPGEGRAAPESLRPYTGLYRAHWAETEVFFWQGGLAMMTLPTDDPAGSIRKLRQVKDNSFKAVRDDGELGEEVLFEFDAKGAVKWLKSAGYYSMKAR
ncbi:MAG TPA: serine hydrolase domain-containing protein [Candidatus Aminicenantes bacterium]|nr:serine hydrolase domain-containing protein [Candidatus Aminicenantes bacterium]